MRNLIYVPIIHSAADMGSLGTEFLLKGVYEYGKDRWQKHNDTINGYWNAIETYFEKIDICIQGTKIYQDGIFVEGEAAIKIIGEGIKSGSKNSKIILKLIDRGAVLIMTEDLKMVLDEYNGLHSILKAKNNFIKLWRLLRYKILKPIFLTRRDKFIAGKIDETLGQNETGILFIGAYHKIKKKLPKDIVVTELKEISKILKYLKSIKSNNKIKILQCEELSKYLITND